MKRIFMTKLYIEQLSQNESLRIHHHIPSQVIHEILSARVEGENN